MVKEVVYLKAVAIGRRLDKTRPAVTSALKQSPRQLARFTGEFAGRLYRGCVTDNRVAVLGIEQTSGSVATAETASAQG